MMTTSHLSSARVPEPTTLADPITVLCVDGESLDEVAAGLTERDGFEVRRASSLSAGTLGTVDCVVGTHDPPARDGIDLVSTVRDRRPSLPVVLLAESPGEVVASLEETDPLEVVRRTDPGEMLPLVALRIETLVAAARARAVTGRALAAVETTADGVGIAKPGGTLEFVDGAFARQFGYDRADLIGRHWYDCFPDEERERLESSALPSVRDDWQWIGRCEGLCSDGDVSPVQARIAALDDGSLVFSVSTPGDD